MTYRNWHWSIASVAVAALCATLFEPVNGDLGDHWTCPAQPAPLQLWINELDILADKTQEIELVALHNVFVDWTSVDST